jgi:hypothetical protein
VGGRTFEPVLIHDVELVLADGEQLGMVRGRQRRDGAKPESFDVDLMVGRGAGKGHPAPDSDRHDMDTRGVGCSPGWKEPV